MDVQISNSDTKLFKSFQPKGEVAWMDVSKNGKYVSI